MRSGAAHRPHSHGAVRRLGLAVLSVLVIGAGLAGLGGGVPTSGAAVSLSAPLPPTSVTIAQAGVAPDVTVTWTYATLGSAATEATVQLYSVLNSSLAGAREVSQITCGSSCTTTTFRSVAFGTLYVVLVWPTNAAGTGVPAASLTVMPKTSCAVGACVTLNATTSIGAATHAASGIVASAFPKNAQYPNSNDTADMVALDTTMFRSAPAYTTNGTLDWAFWNAGASGSTQTTLVLSDLWSTYNQVVNNDATPPTPWSNWTTYTNWVKSIVSAALAAHEAPTYWEVYNEPGEAGYYSAANFATVTPALLDQQFLQTDQALVAADPSAQVIGPSLEHWEDYPGEYGATDHSPDMVTFLNYAATNGIKLAAVSWHEIDDSLGPNPDENTLLPADIEDHVAEARRLIASLPALGNPQIFINEFGMPEVQLIPGWDVGYLAALTNAGVNSGGRSCWNGACGDAALDGLLDPLGVTPQNDYFDRVVYAAMSGNMIATTSTNDFVTALGSFNSGTNTLTALVGRGQGCAQESGCTTAFPGDTDATPTSVTITVTVPWTAGTVTIVTTDVPGSTLGATAAPKPVTTTATITPAAGGKGTVTVSVPSFTDGDAYGFTITKG